IFAPSISHHRGGAHGRSAQAPPAQIALGTAQLAVARGVMRGQSASTYFLHVASSITRRFARTASTLPFGIDAAPQLEMQTSVSTTSQSGLALHGRELGSAAASARCAPSKRSLQNAGVALAGDGSAVCSWGTGSFLQAT